MNAQQYFVGGFAVLCVLAAVYLRKTSDSEMTVGILLFISVLCLVGLTA